MTTVSKSTPLGSLGLGPGDHVIRLRVGLETVSFEVESGDDKTSGAPPPRKPTGFLQKWRGSARKIEDPADAWLSHINEKHLSSASADAIITRNTADFAGSPIPALTPEDFLAASP